MRLATAMGNIDWLGSQGGSLAFAFAAGCVATFAFVVGLGAWLWKIIGKSRTERITELKKDLLALKDEMETRDDRCQRELADQRLAKQLMETRLVQRIQTLEGALLNGTSGPLRQQMQSALSEERVDRKKGDE